MSSPKSQCIQRAWCTVCNQPAGQLRKHFCWSDFYDSRASAGLFTESAHFGIRCDSPHDLHSVADSGPVHIVLHEKVQI